MRPAPKSRSNPTSRRWGLPGDLNVESVWARLHTCFPEQTKAFGEVVQQRAEGSDCGDIYALKNAILEFSLLAGAAFRGSVHRTVLRWVAERKYAPATVLDVGCDNGVLTCFYALLWPSATVSGIDISTAGIDRARELATSLGLTNVIFLATSVEEFATPGNRGQFSLVLTTTVIHEAGYFAPMESDHWFLDEAFNDTGIPVPEFFSLVASLLSPDIGRWLGAEGVMSPHLLWRWASALQGAGLHLELASSARLKHDDQLLSILVVGRIEGGPCKTGMGDSLLDARETTCCGAEESPTTEILGSGSTARVCFPARQASRGAGQVVGRATASLRSGVGPN